MTVSAVADDRADRFEARTFDQDGLGTIRYRLLSPHSLESGHKYPLVIFLHGAGERGDDNNAQLVHVVKELASDEMMDRSPCFV
ncbi:MAG: hypothetical protein KDA80_18425, partial [Planctomycetaceae bacterium]|nr:hypothetical protein [Planctomycetaceae bacterium]